MIQEPHRARMLAVPLCGERVVRRLESIGIETLHDLEGRDPWELMHEVNLQAGRTIWRPPLAVQALQNLVDAAARGESPRAAARRAEHQATSVTRCGDRPR